MGCPPWVRPCSGARLNIMTEERIAMAPTAMSPPVRWSVELSTIFTRLSVLIMKNGDMPRARTGSMTFRVGRRLGSEILRLERFEDKNDMTHTALAA